MVAGCAQTLLLEHEAELRPVLRCVRAGLNLFGALANFCACSGWSSSGALCKASVGQLNGDWAAGVFGACLHPIRSSGDATIIRAAAQEPEYPATLFGERTSSR